MLYGRQRLMPRGLLVAQDVDARHDTPRALVAHDRPPEFDGRAAFASYDDARLRRAQAE